MNLKTIPLGVIGVALAVAGAIGYSLAPEKLWLVAFLEGSALLCLILFFVTVCSDENATPIGSNTQSIVKIGRAHV